MRQETLRIVAGAAGVQTLVGRATGLDATALTRVRDLGDGVLDVFVTTPFEVVAARRVTGEVSRDGAVVAAVDLLDALTMQSVEIGAPRDPQWPGALPPADGYELLDTVPVDVVRRLVDAGQALARQFSGPLGPPASLLNQPVLTVTHEATGTSVAIPMRLIFTCTSLGLIPGAGVSAQLPRHVRVAARGRWVRVDAPFGSAYWSAGLGNVLVL